MSAYRRLKLEPICIDRVVIIQYSLSWHVIDLPQKISQQIFLPSIYPATKLLFNIRNELLTIGDLNFNMYVDGNTEADSQLTEFCDCFCVSNKITEPTRVTNNFASLIDVILTSNPERFDLSGTIKLGISDDDLIRHHTKAENSTTST